MKQLEQAVMEIGRHIDEDDFERFSMGRMPEAEAAPFEEHLLLCEACRAKVAESDEFAGAMKAGAARLLAAGVRVPPAPARMVRRFQPAWALACASIGVAFLLTRAGNSLHTPAAVPVALFAMRGELPSTPAKAGERLALTPDVTALPTFASYRLELVDALGRAIVDAEWKQSPVITPPLAAGTYFVRIYAPAGELLREYGLVVKARQ